MPVDLHAVGAISPVGWVREAQPIMRTNSGKTTILAALFVRLFG
ncbi:hypothetical protein ACRASX_15030 [Flavobacterium sp. TMP13]